MKKIVLKQRGKVVTLYYPKRKKVEKKESKKEWWEGDLLDEFLFSGKY